MYQPRTRSTISTKINMNIRSFICNILVLELLSTSTIYQSSSTMYHPTIYHPRFLPNIITPVSAQKKRIEDRCGDGDDSNEKLRGFFRCTLNPLIIFTTLNYKFWPQKFIFGFKNGKK